MIDSDYLKPPVFFLAQEAYRGFKYYEYYGMQLISGLERRNLTQHVR